MPRFTATDPWPRMKQLVAAAIAGLHRGRFIEDTLEALCAELGAASAWSTLETKGSGPLHRSRTASFHGVSPAVLASHVTEVLDHVQAKLETVSGKVPYAPRGSFIAVPLWSHPPSSREGRTFVGALYLEFADRQGTLPSVVEFTETAGLLLGGLIAQQAVIEDTQEDLRVERAKDRDQQHLTLEELLSPQSMLSVRDELRAAVRGNASIMIMGESGTGKTQLATAFARASSRGPIVRATLGMADDLNTITSELFGHERGAFSGAVSKRTGLVEYADGGTLILDEVLNLPAHAQQLLLDFTQFGSYRPLGYQGREPKTANLRLISLTNGDMDRAIAEGAFRKDLYYRLATVPLRLPPLRERRRDIPEIAARYLNRTDTEADWELDGSAMEALLSPRLDWAGNIRELEAVLERARNRACAGGCEEHVIGARHFDADPETSARDSRPPSTEPRVAADGEEIEARWDTLSQDRHRLDAAEKAIIEDALEACGGIVARTARLLSVPRTGLISRMATLDIDPERFKRRRRRTG